MTNGRTIPKRDKHVARSARVLTTGISIASVLGLTSAYALAAQQSNLASANAPIAATPDVGQLVAPLVSTPVIAPTQPAPATPATSGAAAITTAPPTTATAPPTKATAVTPHVKIKVPKPAATRSSGSK